MILGRIPCDSYDFGQDFFDFGKDSYDFLDFYDLIHLRPTSFNKHKVYFTGKFARGISEKNTISKIVDKILALKDIEIEIIIIDDCSTDGTKTILENDLFFRRFVLFYYYFI